MGNKPERDLPVRVPESMREASSEDRAAEVGRKLWKQMGPLQASKVRQLAGAASLDARSAASCVSYVVGSLYGYRCVGPTLAAIDPDEKRASQMLAMELRKAYTKSAARWVPSSQPSLHAAVQPHRLRRRLTTAVQDNPARLQERPPPSESPKRSFKGKREKISNKLEAYKDTSDSEPTVVRRCSGPKRLGPHEVPIPAPQGGKVLQGSTEDLAEESSGEDVGWRLPVIATRRVLGREDEPSVLEMDLDVYSICSLGNMIQSDEIRLLRRIFCAQSRLTRCMNLIMYFSLLALIFFTLAIYETTWQREKNIFDVIEEFLDRKR